MDNKDEIRRLSEALSNKEREIFILRTELDRISGLNKILKGNERILKDVLEVESILDAAKRMSERGIIIEPPLHYEGIIGEAGIKEDDDGNLSV